MAQPSSPSAAATMDNPIAPMGQSAQLPTVPARASALNTGEPATRTAGVDESADQALPHPATKLPLSVTMRSQKIHFLWQQALARGAANQMASATLLPLR